MFSSQVVLLPRACHPRAICYNKSRVGRTWQWAEAHFFIALLGTRSVATKSVAKMDRLERIREVAERVATSEGLELVEVEYLGRSPSAILRIFLDKPGGISIGDCQNVSQQVGAILDVEDLIDRSYTLEVSSPGLDRKLLKPADYQRFAGRLVKIVLQGPRQGPRRFRGRLLGMVDGKVQVDTGDGQVVQLEYSEIEKANLVVEFGKAEKPNRRS